MLLSYVGQVSQGFFELLKHIPSKNQVIFHLEDEEIVNILPEMDHMQGYCISQ